MNAAASEAVRAARRVLVVDDNRDSADSMAMLLQLRGYDVRVAYDGPEGVKAALGLAPDVVLCDIGLPGLDGFGVAKALRKHPQTAKARLIAITGYGSEQTKSLCQEAGFDRHFTKPVDPSVLAKLLAA
ncbi:MAG TPA: response regulator [Gemmataceae bacterium]|nr:response regulator [Gemmataceae bacterium]